MNIKYHYDLSDLEFIKSLDEISLYKIYFHYWLNNRILNATTTIDLRLIEFSEFTLEKASDYYWRFKNEIRL